MTILGFYDCITVSGGFGQGHLPVSALHDMIRLTKQGKDSYALLTPVVT